MVETEGTGLRPILKWVVRSGGKGAENSHNLCPESHPPAASRNDTSSMDSLVFGKRREPPIASSQDPSPSPRVGTSPAYLHETPPKSEGVVRMGLWTNPGSSLSQTL